MRAIKKINNNVVTCIDDDGNELIAMGRGLGFGELPRDLKLSEISRTFYDVGSRYLSAAGDLPEEVLEFATKIVDVVRNQLPYELSPNLTFILADHIAYAVERARKQMYIRMPMAYDVQQSYPDEYRLGSFAVRRIEKEFGVGLPREEAAASPQSRERADVNRGDTRIRNHRRRPHARRCDRDHRGSFGIAVDRTSFAFSRYATHMLYLFKRLRIGDNLEAAGLDASMLTSMREQFPQGASCADAIARHIFSSWGRKLSDDETLYIIIHISRICS